MTLHKFLANAVSFLKGLNLNFCLVGGFATSLRGEPRLTRDVDFAVVVSDDTEAEAIVKALQLKHQLSVRALLENEKTRRIATVRLESMDGGENNLFVLDLLFTSSGIEKETCDDAEVIEIFAGVNAKVALRAHLIAMKLLSVDERTRPRDAEDLLAMLKLADDTEVGKVRQLLELIDARGFNRGRNLEELLEDFLLRIKK